MPLLATPALWIGLAVSVLIPFLSALVSRTHWDASITGFLTLVFSTATGFLTELGHHGPDYRWQAALTTALLSLIVAAVSQSRILSGTQLEALLLAVGSKLHAPTDEVGDDPTEGLTYSDPEPATGEPVGSVTEQTTDTTTVTPAA